MRSHRRNISWRGAGSRIGRRGLAVEQLEVRSLLAAVIETASPIDTDALPGPPIEAVPLAEPAPAEFSTVSASGSGGGAGNLVHVDTKGVIDKANHSPVFFHDGRWWGVFKFDLDGAWWLWEKNAGNWSRTSLQLIGTTNGTPDAILDSALNRLFVLISHGTDPRIHSATYTAGTWSIDPNVNGIGVPGLESNPEASSLAYTSRWTTPTLFAFKYDNTSVQVNWSTDFGQSWQPTATTIVDVLEGLTRITGNVDATEFSWDNGTQSEHYVGIAYAENTLGQFGFLRLAESDTPSVKGNWNHSILPPLGGDAKSDDHVSIMRDASMTNNRLFVGVKAQGGTAQAKNHALFVRANDVAGTWSAVAFDISNSRLSVVYDTTNDEIYFISSSGSGGNSSFRKSLAGTIDFGPEISLIQNGTDLFTNGATSHSPINGLSGLVYVSANTTTDDLWEIERPLPLIGDMDIDVDVDFDDISSFVLGLTDRASYQNQFGVAPFLHGDTDGDGDLDFDDIRRFALKFSGSSSDMATAAGNSDSTPGPNVVTVASPLSRPELTYASGGQAVQADTLRSGRRKTREPVEPRGRRFEPYRIPHPDSPEEPARKVVEVGNPKVRVNQDEIREELL